MGDKKVELCKYRMSRARETLQVAEECYQNNHYKDAMNRSYYAAFYGVKSVLALEEVDFNRHKDVIAYFNKTYVAGGKIDRSLGRSLGKLQQMREKSDYDDFYVVSGEEAKEQLCFVRNLLDCIERIFIRF
ncbi:MAG: HEPN domain-containing protein [Butyrivibrio sp.]|nr:HEPN domain-containing protein [Butyrivibrio sp.]